MKKIGILTFHYADNYGAVLQSFALWRILNLMQGYEAEIINYVPSDYYYVPYENGDSGYYFFQEKRNKFRLFLSEECKVKINSYVMNGDFSKDYDLICVGSDQVWNLELRENSEIAYFLPNVSKKNRCFSYAASVGTKVEKIDSSLFKQYLTYIKGISLREEVGYKELFNDELGKDVQKVLDPTLLLDRKEYEKIITKEKMCRGKFIFFFWYNLDDKFYQVAEFVNCISYKYDLPIVHNIVNVNKYVFANDGGCMNYSGIEEFLWYIKNAEYIITNSFHGLALSLKFEKKFYIHISEFRKQRLVELVNEFNLNNRILNKYMKPSEIEWNINYDSINKELSKWESKSLRFIEDMLYD